MSPPLVSVVVPVHDHASTLDPLVDRIVAAMAARGGPFEVVLVDDGSTDGSWARIERRAAVDGVVRGIRLRSRFGQVPAIAAGVQHCVGELVVYLDADLEYDPADLPLLVARLEDGADMVSAVRRGARRRPLLRRAMAWLLRRFGPRFATARFDDLGSGMKGWRRGVWEQALVTPMLCRDFAVMGQFALLAGRIDNVEVSWQRPAARSSYRVTDLVALGLQFAVLSTPAVFASLVIAGAVAAVLGLVALVAAVVAAVVGGPAMAWSIVAVGAAAVAAAAVSGGLVGLSVRRLVTSSGPLYEVDRATGSA